MKEREENCQQPQWDRHLDAPAEANTEKHINFLDTEDQEDSESSDRRKDKATEERQKQWRDGLEEGKRANRQDS